MYDIQFWGGSSRCLNNAKYERDGKWYCGVHDPVRIAAREEKKRVEREKEQAEKKARKAAKDEAMVRAHPLFVQMLEALGMLKAWIEDEVGAEIPFPEPGIAIAKARNEEN